MSYLIRGHSSTTKVNIELEETVTIEAHPCNENNAPMSLIHQISHKLIIVQRQDVSNRSGDRYETSLPNLISSTRVYNEEDYENDLINRFGGTNIDDNDARNFDNDDDDDDDEYGREESEYENFFPSRYLPSYTDYDSESEVQDVGHRYVDTNDSDSDPQRRITDYYDTPDTRDNPVDYHDDSFEDPYSAYDDGAHDENCDCFANQDSEEEDDDSYYYDPDVYEYDSEDYY